MSPGLARKLFDAPNIDLGPALTEALCTWECLRTLGFSADDIYLSVGMLDDGRNGIRIELRAQGKDFLIDIAAVEASGEKIKTAWEVRCRQHNAAFPNQHFSSIVKSSGIYARRAQLVMGLKLKGFSLVTDAP